MSPVGVLGAADSAAAFALQRFGPFLVNWDDPNVGTTGVPIVSLTPDQTILAIWAETTIAFAFAGGATDAGLALKTAHQTILAEDGSANALAAADAGVDVAQASAAWFDLANNGGMTFPLRVKQATDLSVVLYPNDNATFPTGAFTAGQIAMYLLIATP